ncbi:MAG: isochorismatase family protein [Nitrospira sp.]
MISLTPSDALLILDIQNDFLPGGTLGISDGDKVIPVLTNYINRFQTQGLPIFLTRDWHPADHCSFQPQVDHGQPIVSLARSGSLPPPSFATPPSAVTIYKAIDRDQEACSAFQHTALNRHLRALHARIYSVSSSVGWRLTIVC